MTSLQPAFNPLAIDERPDIFHHRPFDGEGRSLWFPTLTAPRTLVLGSSQPKDDVDLDRLTSHGIEIAKRRTGGGAVLVGSEELIWFDVVLPSTDPLWHHDVSHSFDWLGICIQRALSRLGVETERHTGALISTAWSKKVCFAGLGPGELTVDGHKVVGMSQRRTRTTSRIQVAMLLSWDGALYSDLLKLDEAERSQARELLKTAAKGIDRPREEIVNAVLTELRSR